MSSVNTISSMLLINHLTRMQKGYFCAAGLNLKMLQYIRPTFAGKRLGNYLISEHKNCFEIGSVVAFPKMRHIGAYPMIEDYELAGAEPTFMYKMTPTDFIEALKKVSHEDVISVFGEDLKRIGNGFGVEIGRGKASLGCIKVKGYSRLSLNEEYNKIRFMMHYGKERIYLTVTDLRLYDDEMLPKKEIVYYISKELSKKKSLFLSLGLTRPWSKPGSEKELHWLQVNNIYLENDPFLEFL